MIGHDTEGAVARVRAERQLTWSWVRQADRDGGVRQDGLTTDEKEELRRVQR